MSRVGAKKTSLDDHFAGAGKVIVGGKGTAQRTIKNGYLQVSVGGETMRKDEALKLLAKYKPELKQYIIKNLIHV